MVNYMPFPLHPVMVHFVIALFPFSVLMDILGWLKNDQRYHFAGFMSLGGAVLGIILAVISGLLEKDRITIPMAAMSVFDYHETLAFISTSIVLGLFLWRAGMRGILRKNIRLWYLLTALVGTVTLMTVGFYGGKLVYQHRIGVYMSNPEVVGKKSGPATHKPKEDWFYESTDTTGH